MLSSKIPHAADALHQFLMRARLLRLEPEPRGEQQRQRRMALPFRVQRLEPADGKRVFGIIPGPAG
jgi:hypothetical protein